jgi:hypothetical protein
MFNDYYDFNIAQHFLPALFNGDDSGLDDIESMLIEQFADHWQGLKNATWNCNKDYPEINRCDVTGLIADTYPVRLYFTNESLDHANHN